jgi:membrane-bound transcription factor site-1 protease
VCADHLRLLSAAQDILLSYQPRASVVPAALDLTDSPFMWPFYKQPLYAGAMPTMFNATVLNGMSLTGGLRFWILERLLTC